MCLPAALALPFAIASTVVSTAGTVMSAIGQSQQANFEAKIAEENRRVASQQANDAAANAELEAVRRYRQIAQTKGQQTAAMAANGVDLSFGTALDIQRDTAMIGAEDITQIYKGGNEQTIGLDREGWGYGAEARARRAQGKGALVSGFFDAAGTALGGASQVAKMKKPI